MSGAQCSFAGGFGFGLRASTTRDRSHNPIPTPTKIAKAHRIEFIDLPLWCSAASSQSVSELDVDITDAVEGFLDRLDLRDVTLAGVSIGGSIALIIASRRNPRVARVIAMNPYDYAKGRGMARSSLFGWIVTYLALIPLIGETVMRLRNFLIVKAILNGGVVDAQSIPPALLKEMYLIGNRPGHYRAFLSLLRNSESWEEATKEYGRIDVPVLLLWGEQDWATPSEREHDRMLIKDAEMMTIERGGHFLTLDRPEEVRDLIVRFATPGQ
jgi:pimeloyl-ACP methyl ester carboxylesterase